MTYRGTACPSSHETVINSILKVTAREEIFPQDLSKNVV